MARIRQLKPEFWRSPDTASASAVARLLYMAMWNWADDAGRGEADLKALEGFAFPNDDIRELSVGTSENFRHVLSEVQKCFGVVFYQVSGKPYYEIPSWQQHQRNERLAKGKHPTSEEGVTWDFMAEPTPGKTLRRKMSELPKTSVPVSGSQGVMVSGDHGVMGDVSDAPATIPDSEPQTPAKAPSRKRAAPSTSISEDWQPDPDVATKLRDEFPSVNHDHELASFRDYYIGHGKKMKDWNATWRNWVRRASTYAGNRSSSTSSFGRPSMTEALTPHLTAGEKLIAAAQAQQHALRDESLTLALETPQTSIERPF